MIPIKLTENHYVNLDAIANLRSNPKTAGDASAMFIVFTEKEHDPLELHGAEAEEAMVNWRRFYQQRMPPAADGAVALAASSLVYECGAGAVYIARWSVQRPVPRYSAELQSL